MAGISVQAIRYYERMGLIRPPRRTSGGYRAYPPDTVALLKYIRKVQQGGAHLEDIRENIARRREGQDNCRRLLAGVGRRNAECEAEMKTLRAKLRHGKALYRFMARCLAGQCANKGRTINCPILRRYSRLKAACIEGNLAYPKGVSPFT